jgi:predicted glycoside hydrolase/deacetylase ChbG (UPF0249 family)
MLHTFSRQFRDRTQRAGMLTPDGVIGVIETGSLGDADALLHQVLSSLPEGTWEFVCHPGYSDAELSATGTRLVDSRDEERRLLVSAELRQFVNEQDIQVIGYREFVEKAGQR